MNFKRTMTMVLALLVFSTSLLTVTASETVTAMPVLISIQQEEIMGDFVSYEEGLLTLNIDEMQVTVQVDPEGATEEVKEVTEATYGLQFAKLQEGTKVVLMVTQGEASTYRLESLVAIHQMFASEGPTTLTKPVAELISELLDNSRFDGMEVIYKDIIVELDIRPQSMDGKVMVPLRAIAESLGYEVKWNNETRSIDLINGPHYTSVVIGKNSYFKNKMAASELSSAPVIVESRTLVPVEFITEILGYGVEYREGQLKIYEEPFTTLTGYINMIEILDDYSKVYIAPRLGDDVEMWEQTVLIVSEKTMNNYGALVEGELINGVHLPVMTMSIPGQTSAVILY